MASLALVLVGLMVLVRLVTNEGVKVQRALPRPILAPMSPWGQERPPSQDEPTHQVWAVGAEVGRRLPLLADLMPPTEPQVALALEWVPAVGFLQVVHPEARQAVTPMVAEAAGHHQDRRVQVARVVGD